MGNRTLIRHRGLLLLALAAFFVGLLMAPSLSYAAPAGFSRPFTHYADDEDLPVVLTAFARAEGFSAAFSPGVVGKVSGRFDAVPPDTFLRGMQAAFGISWYRLGTTLYFYSESEISRTFITPRAMSAERLYQMLRQSAVFAAQLPATLAPGGDMIVVSGPPSYLSQVMAAVSAFEESQLTHFVMKVFPLKYAWAEDMSVSSMDKTVTIPGVASILRAMVTGSPVSATRVTQETATVDKLSGTGLVAQGRMTPVAPDPVTQQAALPQAAPVPATQVNIMADPRVNAVLVNDAEYRMPYYAKVISDLDKPVELVEIHAAIVDIDTNFKRDLGVTYQGANRRDKGWSVGGEFSGDGNSFSPLPSMGKPSGTGMDLSTIYTHGSDYFLARVQALEAEGEARMLGRPSVLTVDNVQATLENTSTYYIQVEGYQAVDLFKVEAGTVLRVTPHIIRNERGETSIKLAVSVQDDQNDDGNSQPATTTGVPPIKQTKINTQAIVGAGQSLLIGGYYYEQKSTDASGIPILMHIPVLGHLFKTTNKGTKRMERLILITPKVIHLDEIPTTPPRVDEPTFHRSPTQPDYEERVPAAPQSGCSRKRPRLENPTAPASPVRTVPLSAPPAPQPGVSIRPAEVS